MSMINWEEILGIMVKVQQENEFYYKILCPDCIERFEYEKNIADRSEIITKNDIKADFETIYFCDQCQKRLIKNFVGEIPDLQR